MLLFIHILPFLKLFIPVFFFNFKYEKNNDLINLFVKLLIYLFIQLFIYLRLSLIFQVTELLQETLGPNLELNLNSSYDHFHNSKNDPLGRVLNEISIRDNQSLEGKNKNWNENLESSRSTTGDWREDILNNVMDSFQSRDSSRNVPQGSLVQHRNEEHSILSLSYESIYPDRHENHENYHRNALKTQFQLEERGKNENYHEIFQEKVRSPRYFQEENVYNLVSESESQSGTRTGTRAGVGVEVESDLHSTIELENLLLAMDDVTGNNLSKLLCCNQLEIIT